MKPAVLPGFQASLDYYRISIADAVGTLTVLTQSLNLSEQRVAGYDLELAWAHPVGSGQVSLRGLVNHPTEAYTQAPGSPPNSDLDSPTTPKWRGNLQARYTGASWTLSLQQRYIGKAKVDPNRIEGIHTSDNSVETISYTDVGAKFRLPWLDDRLQLFMSINNVFDRDPPIATPNPTSFSQPTNALAYETAGRFFTLGLNARLQ